MSGFTSYAERIDAQKIRARSASFFDHFSQATLFFNSQTEPEQNHIINALRFELGKVETAPIRERMLFLLAQVDAKLANRVAQGLGASVPKKLEKPMNMSMPADANPRKFQPKSAEQAVETSAALSMINNPNFPNATIKTRKVAFLIAEGFDDVAMRQMKQSLLTAGALAMTVAPHLGTVSGVSGEAVKVDFSLLTGASVLFDAVYVPGGEKSVATLKEINEAAEFVAEAYKHCKTIGASGAGVELLEVAGISTGDQEVPAAEDPGIIIDRIGTDGNISTQFISAMGHHRHWAREQVR